MVEPNTATDIAIERVSMFLSACLPQNTKGHYKSSGFDDFNQKVMIKREPAPYGTCIFDWAEIGVSWDGWNGSMPLAYTQGVVPGNLKPC